MLRPLLDFDASSGDLRQTPTKEEANAAKRKQMYSNISSGSNGRKYSQDSNLSGYHGSTRFGPPLPAPSPTTSQPSQHSGYHPSRPDHQHGPSHWGTSAGQFEPPTKRHRYGEQDSNPSFKVEASQEMEDQQPFTQSFEPVSPLHPQKTKNYNLSKDIMINLFLEPDTPNATSAKDFLEARSNEIEMDVIIDEYSHTALHWAAALARIPTVETLIRKGANPRRVNDSGETPLIRAVLVTNNHDQQSFSRLLESLHPAIPIADNNGRTILHHIAVTAGVKGRSAAARYYLESLLEFIARGKGSVSLTYFRNHVLDAQDQYGDTALNIAARVGNKSLVDQLQELSADAYLPNKLGLRAIDFDIGRQVSVAAPVRPSNGTAAAAAGQKSKDIMQGNPLALTPINILEIRSLLDSLNDDFNNEIQQKQTFLDEAHATLKDKTRELRDTRRKLHLLKEQTTTFEDLQKRSKNLDRAIQEEEIKFYNQGTKGNVNGDAMSFAGPFDADAPMIVKLLDADGTTDARPLPPASILRAWIVAYKKNNTLLKNHIDGLLCQNKLTEDKIKLVVSKCAGVPLENLDMLLDALLQAIDSDGSQLDQNELMAFLNRIPRVS